MTIEELDVRITKLWHELIKTQAIIKEMDMDLEELKTDINSHLEKHREEDEAIKG